MEYKKPNKHIEERSKVTVSFPVHRPRVNKKLFVIIGGMVAIIGILVVGILLYQHRAGTATSSPDYQTVLPKGAGIETFGGWQRVSPPGQDPVFAYADTINEVPISVSQQPLPESFKADTDKNVAELAKKFNATIEIDAGGTKIYVGTSAKGPQSAILTKNNLLILIKSQEKINTQTWVQYVESLQ